MKKILEITTNIGCNMGCIYCPQNVLNKAYKMNSVGKIGEMLQYMDFINYIESVPTSTDIHFSGFTEPWHNPNCLSMVNYASNKGHSVAVFTTGFGINSSQIPKLESIPFNRFSVHLPDADSYMKFKFGNEYLALLVKLYLSKIVNLDFFTLGRPHPVIQELIGKHPYSLRIQTRANTLRKDTKNLSAVITQDEISTRIKDKTIKCRKDRIYSNVLLPNGAVFLCSMDYGLKQKIGILTNGKKYEELFQSKEFKEILDQLDDPNSKIICRECEYAIPRS